ncbi:MAG TPA: exosortase F system-associated protein [Flavobacterium sp.]|jgi:exosortase F-associated protein
MRAKQLNHWPKIVLCTLLVAVLAGIRAYETELFYDPFAQYFENEYLNNAFPAYDLWQLVGSLSFRYLLNMVVSLTILYVLFRDRGLVRFCGILYGVFFVILMSAFLILLHFFDSSQNFTLFYVRRFLIQPLFLLLFIPASYYQSRLTKN